MTKGKGKKKEIMARKNGKRPGKKFGKKIEKKGVAKPRTVEGVLRKTRKGMGFVVTEQGMDDIYIAARNLNGGMDGDTVEASLYTGGRRGGSSPEGRIERILQRNLTEVVGTFQRNKMFALLIPENRRVREDIFIGKDGFGGAKKGDKVLVKITRYPDEDHSAEGRVTEIISRAGEAGGDIRALVRAFGLREDFPDKVSATAGRVPRFVGAEEFAGEGGNRPPRRDLRGEKIFTIDGADSKDFDDAVSIRRLENGNYLLGVHIADVSHYVKEDSPLDKEALQRGTSVYLPGVVVPMLPEALSNGICSLNEKVDRLTLSIDMEVTEEGEVVAHEIYEAVIHSVARLIYDDISDLLENDDPVQAARYAFIREELSLMKELADILSHARDKRGSIDFDLDEAAIHLNKMGAPVGISLRDRRVANRLIEEFMLLANETVAEHFYYSRSPFVYRVHERPDPEKMAEFGSFIAEFGLQLKGNPAGIRPRELNRLLHQIEGKPEENIISSILLRSMRKAAYSAECLGHFGLALKYYCHFTSPIRRYPDLMIHRIIKESLTGPLPPKRLKGYKARVSDAARLSSEREQQAVELEREAEKLKKTELMVGEIGRQYTAVVSGVTSFGIFAALENTIEGLIRMEELYDDYYEHDPKRYRLVGRDTGRVYALGDRLKIAVKSADVDNREINFTIVK